MEAAIFLSLATILGVSVGLVDVFGNDTPVEEDETVSTDEDTDVSEDDTDPADDNIPVARNDTASTDDDIPLAEDDTAETTGDTAVSIDVLGNDSDPDGDPLTVTAASAPNGSVTVEDDNSLTYTPNAGFTGPDTITYEISDGAGGTATASVAMSVAAANSAPLAEDDTAETTEDTAVSIDVLGNDSDPDGDPLSVTTASAANGSVTVEDDNSLTYTPNAGFTGPDTITYEISDGAGGTATAGVEVSVAPAPMASVAVSPNDGTSDDDGSIVGGSDDELLVGSEGDDDISGGDGADTIFGQAGSDTLDGNAGDDEINGLWDGNADAKIEEQDRLDPDVLLGGEGNDAITMGSGDTATGGDGTDTFHTGTWVDPDSAPVVFDLASDELLVVSVPEGASTSTSITLETDPLTGDTLVQANLQTVAVVAAGAGPVVADQVLVVENPDIA